MQGSHVYSSPKYLSPEQLWLAREVAAFLEELTRAQR